MRIELKKEVYGCRQDIYNQVYILSCVGPCI